MRNGPSRGRRTFRPLADLLESLVPVSSLAPGLTTVVGGRWAHARVDGDDSSRPSTKPAAPARLAVSALSSQARVPQRLPRG